MHGFPFPPRLDQTRYVQSLFAKSQCIADAGGESAFWWIQVRAPECVRQLRRREGYRYSEEIFSSFQKFPRGPEQRIPDAANSAPGSARLKPTWHQKVAQP